MNIPKNFPIGESIGQPTMIVGLLIRHSNFNRMFHGELVIVNTSANGCTKIKRTV